jgi:hypothetical protein
LAGAQGPFDWMAGEWSGTFNGASISEVWTKKDGYTFEGKGYVVSGNDTVVRETLLIQKIGKHWVYIAGINERNPVLFTLESPQGAGEIAFANKEHDFPQRIVYIQKENGEMHAKIEGKVMGKRKREEYIYKRK